MLSSKNSSDTNRYLFSTKEFDSRSGLYYFGARYYDPEVGRWLTPDPMGFVDGMNLYAYVNNNPINMVDPYGYLGERITDWWDSNSDSWLDNLEVFSNSLLINPMADGLPMIPLDQGIGFIGLGTVKTVKYWQYFTKGWRNFRSSWFVKGINGKPPYKLGKEAREALNLPKKNKGTAVQPYNPEKIVGPRTPNPKPKWGWPNKGKGKEYFDGDAFPD